jgi:hypothetical protein
MYLDDSCGRLQLKHLLVPAKTQRLALLHHFGAVRTEHYVVVGGRLLF